MKLMADGFGEANKMFEQVVKPIIDVNSEGG
jgi:hypothetical protein